MASQARKRLVDTAERLFYAEGIRAVGVERILDESGVGRASFYRHFASKDSLVVAVLRQRDAAWRDWLENRVDALAHDTETKPLAVFDALAERFAAGDFRGCAFINAIVEAADPASQAHHVADEHKKAVARYLTGLLHNAGYADPGELANTLQILIDGAIVTALRERTPAAAHRAKTSAATLLNAAPRHR
jgi:AcrR family transcriptional regulator